MRGISVARWKILPPGRVKYEGVRAAGSLEPEHLRKSGEEIRLAV
jgi:hypothetical protein